MPKKKDTGELPALTQRLLDKFGDQVTGYHAQHGDETVTIQREGMLDVFKYLRNDKQCAMDMMVDLTAVDYHPASPRFEVVVHLKSIAKGHRLRVKIPLAEEAAEVDSITKLWVAADWYERECWEMYGINFAGHPNLEHLLLYDGFQGHPLRKDYEKELQQPRVPLRTVRERHDYGERFQYVEGVAPTGSGKEMP